VRHKFTLFFCCVLLAGSGLIADSATAQTKAFRQSNLSSSVSGAAANNAPNLINPWAIAGLPGQPFFIADNGAGLVSVQDSAGVQTSSLGLSVPSGDMNRATPTGIASDGNNIFGPSDARFQYVVVSQDGTISGFAITNGKLPTGAMLARDDSSAGAVYTAVALLHPSCCAPFVAVANFHDGLIHTFTSSFDLLSGSGSFQDPNLPAGYAPYGMQVIGNQLFITYAVQDAAKRDPVIGAGNGVVDVFDLEGNFARRFATGGTLNAPWGVTQASASFGPFSNAILIGNVGDGTISAFDASSGNFLGQIGDGDGNVIANPGIRGLTFRADGVTDPNTLFFTAESGHGPGGLFGAITTGLVSTTRASITAAAANTGAAVTATVDAGPRNPGLPSGTVTIASGGLPQAAAPLVDGVATLTLPHAGKGMRVIDVQYSGDATFLPSRSQTEMQVPSAAAAADFSVAASPSSVTVSPGQSAPVMVTVTPAGGFNGNVTLSCSSVPGVTCTFGSMTVSTASGPASTTMNVNTTMSTPPYHYGFLPPGMAGLGSLLAALSLFGLVFWRGRRLQGARIPVLTSAAVLAVFALSLSLGGCGYGSSYTPPAQNSGPAVLTVTAQSGSLSHTATVNVTVQ
jgi:uncharacterized protein (TIGR03118 family)